MLKAFVLGLHKSDQRLFAFWYHLDRRCISVLPYLSRRLARGRGAVQGIWCATRPLHYPSADRQDTPIGGCPCPSSLNCVYIQTETGHVRRLISQRIAKRSRCIRKCLHWSLRVYAPPHPGAGTTTRRRFFLYQSCIGCLATVRKIGNVA